MFATTLRAVASTLLVVSLSAVSLSAAELRLQLNVAAGKFDRRNVPVKTMVAVPSELADAQTAVVLLDTGRVLPGQLTPPDLLANPVELPAGRVARQLHFVVPRLAAGDVREADVVIPGGTTERSARFTWNDVPGTSNQLNFGSRPVLRYMYESLDTSIPERRMETYKPYHHVFDPLGKRLMTKGPGGLYPHHRGLFYGFNKISYSDGQTADTWHCRRGEFQSHEGFLSSQAGLVLGRHRMAVDWHGQDGNVFANEQREMTVYNTPDGLLIEFASRLASTVGKLTLKGDPQHAGFQFRASQDVPDKTRKLTYYLRPDGRGEPGRFRNWPANKDHVNLPWNTMSIVLDDQRYTVCYLDTPANPKESRYSERDYGRFGSYFEYELSDNRPSLEVNYRVWLQSGEMTVQQVDAHSRNFVEPPRVTSR